jgi:hypothetical protein
MARAIRTMARTMMIRVFFCMVSSLGTRCGQHDKALGLGLNDEYEVPEDHK